MAKLKELRTQLGVRQQEVADYLGTSVANVSNYENDLETPDLESIIALERSFDQHLEFEDAIPSEEKEQIIEALTNLMQQYPITAVLDFATKAIRSGRRDGDPGKIIVNYAKQVMADEEILLPPDMQRELKRTKTNK